MSVVIATSTAGPHLQAVLERLHADAGDTEPATVEIVIAVPDEAAVIERARTCGARCGEQVVCVVPVPNASVPALYAAGLRAARGACVAMTNDRFLPSAGWLTAVLQRSTRVAHGPATVISGVIDPPDPASLVDRAVYYMEYGAFAPPPATEQASGRSSGAAGANVLYSTAALTLLRPLTEPPAWEYFWHEALAAGGVSMMPDAAMKTRMVYRWSLARAWGERYHYARAFAAEREGHRGRGGRFLRALVALALPPVLIFRLCRQHARHGWAFVSAVPLIGLLTVPWAWGEAMGTWAGAGDSLGRVTLG